MSLILANFKKPTSQCWCDQCGQGVELQTRPQFLLTQFITHHSLTQPIYKHTLEYSVCTTNSGMLPKHSLHDTETFTQWRSGSAKQLQCARMLTGEWHTCHGRPLHTHTVPSSRVYLILLLLHSPHRSKSHWPLGSNTQHRSVCLGLHLQWLMSRSETNHT